MGENHLSKYNLCVEVELPLPTIGPILKFYIFLWDGTEAG